MKKQKLIYLSLLFALYFAIGIIILFFADFTPLVKFTLLAILIFSTHFFKKIIKVKTANS